MQQLFLLELEGKLAGRLFSFSGGTAQPEVIVELTGPGRVPRKHVGGVRFEDIEIACGSGLSKAFYDWVGGSFGGSTVRMSGAVIALDHKYKPKGRLDFTDALISSLTLPALDHASKEPAIITVKIRPERTSIASSAEVKDLGVYTSALPKSWNINSFRIDIDGLRDECAKVTRIESLSLGQKITEIHVGQSRAPSYESTGVHFSNVVLQLPGSYAAGFVKWHEDFAVKGVVDPEKNGSIEFLAPNSRTSYFGVKLSNLGISRLSGALGGAQSLSPVTVELYCEQMSFQAGSAAIL